MNSAPPPADPGTSATTDAALGGRLRLMQPARGHRFGHDAILLAAATDARSGGHVAELGAGVGAAGLALATRLADVRVTLVEIDDGLVDLANANARANGLDDRVRAVALDVTAPAAAFDAPGMRAGTVSHVLMNPPFNPAGRHNRSPDPLQALAHEAGPDTLTTWVPAARRLLAPKGTLTLIWRAQGIGEVLQVLGQGFGGICVMPVHSRLGAPAIRILVRAIKDSRASLALLPGFVLADSHGVPTAEAEAVLRHAAALPMGEP